MQELVPLSIQPFSHCPQGPPTEAEVSGEKEEAEEMPHSLGQLITAFSRAATTEQKQSLSDDFLYVSYAQIMSNVSMPRSWVMWVRPDHEQCEYAQIMSNVSMPRSWAMWVCPDHE